MKKGRHRRFEEARKLKQSGPDFLFSNEAGRSETNDNDSDNNDGEEDHYAELARKYGALDEDSELADPQ
ncbi:MAG: hypothetical protein EXQ71_04195 [Acidimicrobiia bacterium]|nr:hypothetical protein [Acidimicrobiia bacterium]